MAQTLTCLYLHIIFSTKNRISIITPEVESELFAYIGGIVRNNGSILLAANGTSNHVHLLISMDKNVTIPDLIGKIKRDSSKWIKTKSAMLAKFAWQDGYSAFTVGHTQLMTVKKYIAQQKEHHEKELFETEMRGFYTRYDLDFEEDHVWG